MVSAVQGLEKEPSVHPRQVDFHSHLPNLARNQANVCQLNIKKKVNDDLARVSNS